MDVYNINTHMLSQTCTILQGCARDLTRRDRDRDVSCRERDVLKFGRDEPEMLHIRDETSARST